MNNENFIIEKMSRKEMDTAIQWAIDEKWNPGINDADCFYYTDPDGFFIGKLNDEPVACVSAVSYDGKFGFIGYYLVNKNFRGKGFGLKLFNAGMKRLEGMNIGLDGVIAQVENYKKSGFKTVYHNFKYEGSAKGFHSNDIIDITKLSLDDVSNYDCKFFPANRKKFIDLWINQPESKSLGIMKDNNLIGYGVIKKCIKGFRIGPLCAEDVHTADLIINALLHYSCGEKVFLDIPELNFDSLAIFEKNGFTKTGKTARMYTKENPNLPIDKIYSIASLALG